MSDDLISRSKLMDVFRARMVERNDREKCASDENCKVCEPGCFWRRAIPAAPAVDAVPVVRCKDCKHYRYDEDFERTACDIFIMGTDSEHFCSYGERKDNATD